MSFNQFFKFLLVSQAIFWTGLLLLFKREIPSWIQELANKQAVKLEELPEPYTIGADPSVGLK